jgi:hypothetical protein
MTVTQVTAGITPLFLPQRHPVLSSTALPSMDCLIPGFRRRRPLTSARVAIRSGKRRNPTQRASRFQLELFWSTISRSLILNDRFP